MAKEHEIIKAKELRGDIIERLYDVYGEDVALTTLRNILRYRGHNSDNDIEKAVKYLSGTKKEFIEVMLDEDNYWASLISLTPAGVNLAEGDITDMGVMLDE